ncbi:phosphoribosyltransferase-like protein [Shewanella algae]|uniref:phosphoribosyltransferase-like protein n=1 Tax=Shewanella algae TaxID=38313 RepID=UPI0031F4F7AA
MSFETPNGWNQYYSSVISKTRLLIKQGIWEELDELNLNRWLSNFTCDKSKYLSACMLDALIYRSNKMCHSMMRKILIEIVPNYCRTIEIENFSSISEWKDKISNGEQLVRFIPVSISDGKVKSSSVVVREFIEANDIPQRCVQQPEKIEDAIKNGTRLVVFLDDFAGSGYQFNKFIAQKNISNYKGKVNFLYVPLAAHTTAISRIESVNDFVKVHPVEVLSSKHEFFHECDEGFFRGDKTNTAEEAKEFYEDYCSNRFDNRKYLFGMSSQCLTYSFFLSCPNNNLKALYHEQGTTWKRLLFRGRS